MPHSVPGKMVELGLRAADHRIFEEDKIWSRYSNDKVNIGEELAKVIRILCKAFPINKPLRALSIGSSNEPQFRILETQFRGGLYLLDIEKEAIDIVKERIHRQQTTHVRTINADYNKIFLDSRNTAKFLKTKLGGQKVNLITLHHSLYYCKESDWHLLLENLYRYILAPKGEIHAVLMSSESSNNYTTGWLYNKFVWKYFGFYNTQSLCKLKKELQHNRLFGDAQILLKSSHVRFFTDDFEKFMAVIWMILLYPEVHQYNNKQKKEIIEFVYDKFWKDKKPLMQVQDHLVIFRGINIKSSI